ncbi:hypothetical protein WICANDRAFT_75859 [Wickerhamomyces anomalus NRRL Y-366-8]|uniref:Uncharacterized protein n=1 Tax=Wickerhamomyces anomalus (strain ATCC 58044 / CBS 1984 / NCYC 433 / NRRL Y-366-8) TaxID=683960 RepID=A0A1E3P8B7_WICAA|nr:uncharacterized protein WICANDRAFT_75859 [Wickerhamomyces anomalus NRRL Y-366-8]ODQ61653.1 hypothetical protein WICANDRAFT_75859 [Wickerhamomyces anomalus NRRL Y-366-8]
MAHPLKLVLPDDLAVEIVEFGATVDDTKACNIYVFFDERDDGCQEVHNVEFNNGKDYEEMECHYRIEVDLNQKVLIESTKKDANGDTCFVEFKLLKSGVEILNHKFIEVPSAGNEGSNNSDSVETPETTSDTEQLVDTCKFGPSMEVKRIFTTIQKNSIGVGSTQGSSNGKKQQIVESTIYHTHVYKPFSRSEPFLLIE